MAYVISIKYTIISNMRMMKKRKISMSLLKFSLEFLAESIGSKKPVICSSVRGNLQYLKECSDFFNVNVIFYFLLHSLYVHVVSFKKTMEILNGTRDPPS
jgi:hypothetical protein